MMKTLYSVYIPTTKDLCEIMFVCSLLLYILLTVFQSKGQVSDIKSVFIKGNANLWWTPFEQKQRERVFVILDGKVEFHDVNSFGKFTLKDILNFTVVNVGVRTYFMNKTHLDSRYHVFKIPNVTKAKTGEDKLITIPIDSVPVTGKYNIINVDRDVEFLTISPDGMTSKDPKKYVFISRKDSRPKSITVKIKGLTTDNAGYISSGTSLTANGAGVVLVVTDAPTKPSIEGNAAVPAGQIVTLTCQSNSTSAPAYYKLLPPLSYSWYRNNSTVTGQASRQWTFRVKRTDEHDSITCMSREEIDSERSEIFKINPLYPPLQPYNFTGRSEIQEQITLSWYPAFNGGLEQFFLIRQKVGLKWQVIRNISDMGEGNQMSMMVDCGVYAEGVYEFSLQSCNTINCSLQVKSTPIKVQGKVLPPSYVNGQALSTSAIRLTWEANNESAPIESYCIYQLFEGSWEIIANESREYHNEMFSYVVYQGLRPERSYSFGISSCNQVTCSALRKVLGVHTLGISSFWDIKTLIVIGLGAGLVICLSIVFASWITCQDKRAFNKRIRQTVHFTNNKNGEDVIVDNQRTSEWNVFEVHDYEELGGAINFRDDQLHSSDYDDVETM